MASSLVTRLHVLCLVVAVVVAVIAGVVSAEEYQICVNKSVPYLTDEQRLYMALMVDYDRNTRPVFNASHTVTVTVGITLTQIFDVDEKNQVLTTNIWLDQSWHDQKLHWNPEDYSGLKKLRIPCSNIWKPDIVLYNSAEDYTNGFMQALAMVQHDGDIFWPPIVKLRSTCQIDITYFPFDDQICKLKTGSWAYDGFQVDVTAKEEPVDLSLYVTNGEWDLVSVTGVRNEVFYPCCPEPFPDVTFTIHIRRRTLYYTYNVIVPCVMLSLLTLLVFWMSPESGEKVTLGLTVLLAFSVFMLMIADNMPATSSFVPLIGIYLTCVMSLTSLSVISAVIVSNINNYGQKEVPLPRALRVAALGVSKILCMKLYFIKPHPGSPKKSARDRQVLYMAAHNNVSNDSGCSLLEFENILGMPRGEGHFPRRQQEPRGDREMDELLKKLHEMLGKEDSKEKADTVAREWQEASQVFDRFLFWVFVIGTLTITILLLVVLPLTKRAKTG